MRVIGKIGFIEQTYSQQKQRQDGSMFWSERYNIFVESGDDRFMVDSGFIHCNEQGGGEAILARRGVTPGALCEAVIRFGFRDYNGRRYHDITMAGYTRLDAAERREPQKPEQEPAQAASPADMPADGMKVESETGDFIL